MKKKLLAILLAVLLIAGTAVSCKKAPEAVTVLFTNDVHCGIDPTGDADESGNITAYKTMGYAGLAAYKAFVKASNPNVVLVDDGDSIQGDVIGTLSNGSYLVDIMNEVGYDVATFGNHEYDYGMDKLFDLTKKAKYTYVSCNFLDQKGKPVYDAYKVLTFGGTKIAFLGISTPESITKSTPVFFQDKDGNYIYSFGNAGDTTDAAFKTFVTTIQNAVNEAQKKADYVVAVGHLGVDESSSPWTSKELIAATTGINVFLDGHSHTVLNEVVKDKDGKDVILAQTGTKLANVGQLDIGTDGTLSVKLVSAQDVADLGLVTSDAYKATAAFVDDIKVQYEALVATVVGSTTTPLVIKDPATGDRIVRSRECNLGDLCADAYRVVLSRALGKPVDVAFVNGGGIRAEIQDSITYGDIVKIHPYGNMACVVEVTGEQIWQALEWGSRAAVADYTAELGGFLQVSGLTYEIHTDIAPKIEYDAATSVYTGMQAGYTYGDQSRVQNIMIGGAPIDLTKKYTLASHNYMLKQQGDGFNMFGGDTLLLDEVMIDNQVLIDYITEDLGGVVPETYANPYGEGRIKIF
ncbi:MAG: bifunctional metallophosphatase/5'-nucleotidase [Eubacteriaceae bacterium]|nr:bifunctional metallophosphatase/5'-nucleotidase [Eubacteriaceae bacterium]